MRPKNSPWKVIINLNSSLETANIDLHSIFCREIGNGSSVSFWSYNWLGNYTLRSLFPRLFSLEAFKECKVSDRCNLLHGPKSRTWNWRRPIRGGLEQSQLLDLLLLLRDVNTNNTPDTWVCNLNTSNSYSVSDLRVKIDNSILEPNGNQTRWNKILPIKINIHSWRLGLDRLPTRCNLDARGIDIHSKRCPVCDEDLESNQHLFVDCFLAASLWRKIAYWWGLDDYPKQLTNQSPLSKNLLLHHIP
ncbi:RNA-directed DNA polymerase, eukaryota, reverse transcriptase zinc-binding domain protein [Tanacetum coccineum]|uniref:RNA-directed DNA polymerase, eukaryota, reverse transcriptase zinc-binding domain protein n=1 Tax=Tanacetum coccineum TaxID=301880 RepID=A0ABQ4YMY9_9ASTR